MHDKIDWGKFFPGDALLFRMEWYSAAIVPVTIGC